MARNAERARARTLGRGVERVDGMAKATGTALYPQDVALPPGCLHAATVRAPVARARIRRVDTAPALAVAGVTRVITATDVRGTNRFGLIEPDQPVLTGDVIRGASDVVALVVAESEHAAREGARRVRVDLVAETPLFDAERACERDAPIVHYGRKVTRGAHPNLLAERKMQRGNAERALARAATVVTGEYRTHRVEHLFLGPEAGLAELESGGRLVLHVATQWPEADLRQAAAALGEPPGTLRILQRSIGGAFGGREDVSLQILLLLAARVTGRPVRMVWDRAESVRGHGKRHPFVIRHRLGANADGRLVAAVIDVLVDAGCYASTSAAVLDNAISQACGPYAIDDVLVTGRAVYTNNPYTCAMRGFGVNQMTFAMEQQVGKIACQLGLEAAVVRRRSFVPTAGRLANGTRVRAADGLPKTLAAVLSRAGRRALPRSIGTWRYGRGSASAAKNVGYSFGFDDRASAEVTRTRNGATVRIGAAECGQGVATVLVQIAAETLDLPPRRVRIEWQDTEEAPEAGSSSASRQTLVSGNAVRGACQAVRRAVDTRGGAAILPQGGITRRYTFRAPRTGEIGARRSAPHAYAYGWASCAAEVRVDIATGCVEVLRIVSAVDAGRVVNRRLFEGQVEGGAVMGQGYALQERFLLRDGMPVSLGFEGCAVPTVLDAAPQIDTIAVECAEPIGPFGARGVGEITMIPVVPAITAAIRDAVGVWIDEIPASPERVRLALASARKSGAGPAPRRRRLRR